MNNDIDPYGSPHPMDVARGFWERDAWAALKGEPMPEDWRCKDCGAAQLWHVIEEVWFCMYCDDRQELIEEQEQARHEAELAAQWAEYSHRTGRQAGAL